MATIPTDTRGPLSKLLGVDLPPIPPVKRVDVMPVSVRMPRAFDLHYEFTSFAPVDERWTCIDLNTYDGAPDSEGCSTFLGRGANVEEAKRDLVAQFREHDDAREPQPTQAEIATERAIDDQLHTEAFGDGN